ncbi:MAG: type II toxin-antitoxin system CcdA family antitoxin [Parvibaculum sp.]|jgi:antitoxin CcdA|uniref:type II toxin-antitoxin system CcdA family antitoxin n=2 Tax=Hyphomicrobiales TaxID=356 RepID=UPI0032EBDE52
MRMAKKAVNLSVDAELLAKAKEMEINLSATLEEVLRERSREEERRRWQEENKEAIEAFNRRIERDGIWSDGLRRF